MRRLRLITFGILTGGYSSVCTRTSDPGHKLLHRVPTVRVKSIRYLGQMCVCVHVCKLTGWILSAVSRVLFFNEAVCLQLSQDHQRAQEAVLHF